MACGPRSACATAIPLGRRLPGASSNLPGRPDLDMDPETLLRARTRKRKLAPPLFGLAPGGVCRAADVAAGAVRSYRTVSPLPQATQRPAAVCSLWHFPWARARRTLSGTARPWSPDFPPRKILPRVCCLQAKVGYPERPSGRLTEKWMAMPALAVKGRRYARSAAPARGRDGQATRTKWLAWTHRRPRPPAPGENGAGRPRPRHAWRNRNCH